ncbi:mucin-17 isoform X2 [Synchiropus splendidus]|uniref:mucin-17 isoform X2 n=1 Tax=Synchiropus splendidus TaxID=270530 RepID=UPI00237D44E3|nr:mucin-17 isoform X2 [Synchiropus splendidus]
MQPVAYGSATSIYDPFCRCIWNTSFLDHALQVTMFRRSRFSVRPNVGATGRTAAPKEPTSVNPEGGESACPVAESTTAASTSVVAPPDNSVALGEGNDPPGEASSSSAAVQRRKRFSVKPKVAPGRPSATVRPTKAPGETAAAASSAEFITKPVSEELSGTSTPPQTGQSPRQPNVSESAEPDTSLINDADTSTVETETIEPSKKEIHSRPPDIAPLSIPNRETNELSEKAKTLMSKPLKLPSIPRCSLSRLLNDPSDIQKIEKTRKLRELLRQEMHKEKNKHRRPKYRVKEFSLDPAKMTMRDLLHYFPTSNPMSSSLEETTLESETVLPNSPQQAVSPETAKEPDAQSVSRDEDEEGAAGEEDDDDAVMVPRVKVAEDGSLIIDEESLTVEVQRTKGPNPTEDKDPIFERGSTTTYSSFRKGTHTKPWSSEETDMFYLAISMVGTDFSMICQLFTHRARAEIKNKFKKEERLNAWRIDKAFRERRKLDLEYFTKLLEKVLEVQKNKKKKNGRPRGKSAAKKRDKKPKGKTVDILSDLEEEDEEEEEEEGDDILDLLNDDDEEEGEKENEDLGNDGGTQVSTQKGKRKRQSKKNADEEMAGKRNRQEKTSEQDEVLTPEDSDTTCPEELTTSILAQDDKDKATPKCSVIKPAKLSRGRAPQPLLPLGKKWSKKLPTVAAQSQNNEAAAAATQEQEMKRGSPERDSSEDEECTVQPSKPTRSGRMPKPIQHLSYTTKEDSTSENNQSSATGTAPKQRQKRGRESKSQSAPVPKKSKLVTLTASQSDYSDDEDDPVRDEDEEDEGLKHGMELSPGKESSAPAFVPVCLRPARVSEEVETIEEDVIDLLSSGTPGVSDASYNEAAQTLLTIGNLTNISQLNETITQDQPSVEAQVAGRSNDVEESLSVGCAGEEQSVFPLLTAEHKSTENSVEPPITVTPTTANAQAQGNVMLDGQSISPEIPVQNSSQSANGGLLPKVKPKPNLNRTSRASKSHLSKVEESQGPPAEESKYSAEASSQALAEDETSAEGLLLHSGLHVEEPVASTSGISELSQTELNKPLKNVATELKCTGASSDLASAKPKDSCGNTSKTSQAEVTQSIRRDEGTQLNPTKEVPSTSDAGEFRAASMQGVCPENLGMIAHKPAGLLSTDPQNTDQKLNKSISDVDSQLSTSQSIVSGAPQSQSTPNKRGRLPKVKPKPNLGRAARTAPPKSQSASATEENQAVQQIPSTSTAGETGQLLAQSRNSESQVPNPHTEIHATAELITDAALETPGGVIKSSAAPSHFQPSVEDDPSQETLSSVEASQKVSGTRLGQTLQAESDVLDHASKTGEDKSAEGKSIPEVTERGSPLTKGGRLSRVKPKPNLARASRTAPARTQLAETLPTSDSPFTSSVSGCTSSDVAVELTVADIASRTEPASSQSTVEDVQNQEILLLEQAKKQSQNTSGTHLALTLAHTTSSSSDQKCSEGKSIPVLAESGSPLTRRGRLPRVKPKPNLGRASKTASSRFLSSTAEEQQPQETLSTSHATEIVLALPRSHVSAESPGSDLSQTEMFASTDSPSTSGVSVCPSSDVSMELPVGDTASRSEPPKPQLSINKVQSDEIPFSKEASNFCHLPLTLERTSPAVSDHGSKTVEGKSCEVTSNPGITEKASLLSRRARLSWVKPKSQLLKRSNEEPQSSSPAAEPSLESLMEDSCADKPIQVPSEIEALSALEPATSGGLGQVATEISEGIQTQLKDPEGSDNVDLTPQLIEDPDVSDKSSQPIRKRFSRLKPKPNLKQASKAEALVSSKVQPLNCNTECSIPAMVSEENPGFFEEASVSATGKSAASHGSVTSDGHSGGTSSSSDLSSRADPSHESPAVTMESAEPTRPIRKSRLRVQPNLAQTLRAGCTEQQSKEEPSVSSESAVQSRPTCLELDDSILSSMLPPSSSQLLPEMLNSSETKELADCSSTSHDLFDWPRNTSEHKAQVIASQVSVSESPSVRPCEPERTSHGEESSDATPTMAEEKTDPSVSAVASEDESHCSSHLAPLQTPKPDLSLQHPESHQHDKSCEDTIVTSHPGSSLKAAPADPPSNSRRRRIAKAKPNLGPTAQAREPKAGGKVVSPASESPATVTSMQPVDNNCAQTILDQLAVLGPTTSTSQESSDNSSRHLDPAQIQAAPGNTGSEHTDVVKDTREVRHDGMRSVSELESVGCPGETTQPLTGRPSNPSCDIVQESCESKEELQMSSEPGQKSTDDAQSKHGSPKNATQTQRAGLVELKPNPRCSIGPDHEAAHSDKVSSNSEPEVQPDTPVPANTAAAEVAGIAAFQTLFPDMLSVPSDPDEPFFVLSLTAVPVCPPGEVEATGAVSYLPTADASEQQRSGESLPVEGDVSLRNVPVEPAPTPVSVQLLHQEQADGLRDTSEKPEHPLVAKEVEDAAVQQKESDVPPAKTRRRAKQPQVKPERKQRSRARRGKVDQSPGRAGASSPLQEADTFEEDASREGGAPAKSCPATSTPLRKPKASSLSGPPESPIPDDRTAPRSRQTIAPVVEEQQVPSVSATASTPMSRSELTSRLQEPTEEATQREPRHAEMSFDGAADEATSVCHYFISDIFTEVDDT